MGGALLRDYPRHHVQTLGNQSPKAVAIRLNELSQDHDLISNVTRPLHQWWFAICLHRRIRYRQFELSHVQLMLSIPLHLRISQSDFVRLQDQH